MNIYKLQILVKEFSFLRELLKDDEREITEASIVEIAGHNLINPEYVKVKRVDENLLKVVPSIGYWGYEGCNYEGDFYIAIKEEDILCLDSWDGEGNNDVTSIGEQLFLQNSSPDYIVHLNEKREGYKVWKRVIIYKADKFDFAAHHCIQIDKAARELKSEIRMTCEEKGGR